MQEVWKDIRNYENLYQISNLGNVKSIARKGAFRKDKVLKCSYNKKGYMYVCLCKNCRRKAYRVHRLVAQAFIPNPENKPQVNHINGNKKDNSVCNLEWTTNKENSVHAHKNNLVHNPIGKENALSKKVLQFDKENNLMNEWIGMREASRELNIAFSSIWMCCQGRIKTAGGYIWRYSDE